MEDSESLVEEVATKQYSSHGTMTRLLLPWQSADSQNVKEMK